MIPVFRLRVTGGLYVGDLYVAAKTPEEAIEVAKKSQWAVLATLPTSLYADCESSIVVDATQSMWPDA